MKKKSIKNKHTHLYLFIKAKGATIYGLVLNSIASKNKNKILC